MTVDLSDHREHGTIDINLDKLNNILEQVVRILEFPSGDIEVTLVDPETIRELNRQYRNIDSVTNVLSFSLHLDQSPQVTSDQIHDFSEIVPPNLLGEVILCVEKIRDDANQAEVSLDWELIRMSIHGMLHLIGFEHDTDMDYEKMNKQEMIAGKFIETMDYRVT